MDFFLEKVQIGGIFLSTAEKCSKEHFRNGEIPSVVLLQGWKFVTFYVEERFNKEVKPCLDFIMHPEQPEILLFDKRFSKKPIMTVSLEEKYCLVKDNIANDVTYSLPRELGTNLIKSVRYERVFTRFYEDHLV